MFLCPYIYVTPIQCQYFYVTLMLILLRKNITEDFKGTGYNNASNLKWFYF